MSSGQIHQISSANFAAIFSAASTEYHRVTGQRLDTHPLATQLEICHGPNDISNLLRAQAQAFGRFHKGDKDLMAWLDPTVHILCAFSATLGEGIALPFSPAKTVFTGIGVLLQAVRDEVASHDTLIRLFERIHFFLQRLNSYTGMSLTDMMTELLGKIMAQLLLILALSTKAMTGGRIKKFVKRLAGRRDVEDALQELDSLTTEESLMMAIRNLEVTHRVDSNVKEVKALTKVIDDDVKATKGLIHDIDDTFKATKGLTEDIRDNVRVID
ncbi:hypothetical protein F5148DRAFT_422001 [Russula earlei]|uniref:Uncharacterized protein n=1 Tax=Russula earlei TaxID=71964 RepID=A0ACC0UH95_9AGAM|nr:hypothetical protein F5148DRAFT_422001 [Russula earlei]